MECIYTSDFSGYFKATNLKGEIYNLFKVDKDCNDFRYDKDEWVDVGSSMVARILTDDDFNKITDEEAETIKRVLDDKRA